jgi:dienelactone hydrolase
MASYRQAAMLLIAGCIAVVSVGLLPQAEGWNVTEKGVLELSPSLPEYQITEVEGTDDSRLYDINFTSQDEEIAGLLQVPAADNASGVPGIVLLPGAGVSKEAEQNLAEYLSGLGYASLTLDQRNLGAIDPQGDLRAFLSGQEPVEHKMVKDALLAAEILRNIPEIDKDQIFYLGESNGARFAIIACALDSKCRGAVAISTCGFGVEDAVSSGALSDAEMIRFYRSIDPETYLALLPPRRLVMIHSQNDTIIACQDAERTFSRASEPKVMRLVGCNQHGYCSQMGEALKEELAAMMKMK